MPLTATIRQALSRAFAQVQFQRLGSPGHILFFGFGIGDDLLMATVARELKRRGDGRIVLFSDRPSLYEGNPDVAGVFPWSYGAVGRLRHWGYPCSVLQYAGYDREKDRDLMADEHALVTMCRLAGLSGSIDLRPYFFLRPEEKTWAKSFGGEIVMQSGGLAGTPNKNWFPDRYQEVCDRLAPRAKIIHLGEPGDPPLAGAVDLRGRTTLREAAALLANARLFIGQAGFLMHLARAVETRSVIVFGGREDPRMFGYSANENLVGRTSCSPCWQRTRCDYEHACMQLITAEEVHEAALRQLGKHDELLPLQSAEI